MANERELCAEIVQSGTWLYDNQVLSEVWIVKQNFEFHYEPDFPDGPEELNADGETFQVVIARDGRKIGLGPARLSLPEAILAAEEDQWLLAVNNCAAYCSTGCIAAGATSAA
jgi:hypothetical protein